PRGPPNALTRGDPSIPAPFARAHFAPLVLNPGGCAPADPPTRSLAGTPSIPTPFARLTSLRSFLIRGAAPPRTPLRAHSRGPLDPRGVRAALRSARSRFSFSGFGTSEFLIPNSELPVLFTSSSPLHRSI